MPGRRAGQPGLMFSESAASTVPFLVVALTAAAVVSYLLTPVVRRLAIRFDAIDHPDARRVNVRPVPRGGGVAVAVAFITISIALLALNAVLGFVPVPTNVQLDDLLGLLLGGVLATAFGVVDDYLDLRARWQFAGQFGLALFAVATGYVIVIMTSPIGSGTIQLPTPVGVGFSIVWIVGMINSINFIDGLDGLSTGIGLIASVTLGVISLTPQVPQPFIAVLCFVLAGSLLGFLRWNFHPATIFAGTSGVMFLGYTLALLSILGTAKVPVALLVLGVPIIDAFWIIVRRLAERRSPFSPDRGHLHHRLLEVGLSHRQTVLLIYGICVVLAVLALLLTGGGQVYAFVGVFVAIGFVLFILARGGFSSEDSEGADGYEGLDEPGG
ncbi:MAG: UDP-GlcNAc:undecaprenyl-phosphate/decaprenyl-phosphate GlcNAc-phosphate transferase [Chloroflexota bacterium]|nr:UDP-GlcNAc:undecaprenyl-phosphate/decaprenyl-phosphate GlcNAc-phosphate transferase [Chloroflexota bacterium]MEA2607591.1 UDP-GlcNAc:undecaprenyl-phosphate/decaprenyl-phosphate GlcNAc-phosphate transferase [Chloroflexota bacterium]